MSFPASHPPARRSLVITLVLLILGVVPAAAQRRGTLIDVPYVSQTERLCGGAALAMVMRYWGGSALAQDFTSLVDDATDGIPASRLVSAASRRGWRALASGATASVASLEEQVAQGRPVIALIEDRPGTFHYVVVVGVTPTHVVLHDPARAPFQVVTRDDFDTRWRDTSRWMLLVLPGPASSPQTELAAAVSRDVSAAAREVAAAGAATIVPAELGAEAAGCDAFVAHGVAEARAGRSDVAEHTLRSAMLLCPGRAGGYRELAGLRLTQRRWTESAELARQATNLEPRDTHAREVLAAARFAAGDQAGALEAWNVLDRPVTGVVGVEGLRRTHQPVLTRYLGLTPGTLLRASAFRRADRRLLDFPTTTRGALRVTPLEDGTAPVTAYVDERRRLPAGLIGWTAVALRGLIAKDIRVDSAALASQGDLWSPSYRWPVERPRVGLELALPVPGGPGLLHVETFWERQTYTSAFVAGNSPEQERRRTSVTYSDWLTGNVHVAGNAALDRIDDAPYGSVGGGLTLWWLNDHLATLVHAERWMPRRNDARGFAVIDAAVDWRSATSQDVPFWTARLGGIRAGADAPLALFPGAGSSADRGIPLRGRPLLRHNVLTGEVFGRQLLHGTVERQHPVYGHAYGRLAVAGFVDVGKAWQRPEDDGASRLHVDVGTGLRVSRPGEPNQLRIDIGVGLRDGGVRVSAGYVSAWGRR